jgi:hypothetical protein
MIRTHSVRLFTLVAKTSLVRPEFLDSLTKSSPKAGIRAPQRVYIKQWFTSNRNFGGRKAKNCVAMRLASI